MTTPKKHQKIIEKKRESRDAALMRGTDELLASGIDLETLEPTAESVSRLAAVRSPSTVATQAIACWLGFAPIPEAASMLSTMEAQARDKELKREIRRSLFRLEQRGVAVPHRLPDSATSPLLAREEDRGYLSHVDGRGDQVIWYVKAESSGDYLILSGVVNDRRGLLESDAGRVTRPALRDLLEGTRKRFSLRLVQADAAYCDLLLHEGYKNSTSKLKPHVARFPSYRMEITHRAPEKVPSPVHARIGEVTRRDESALQESSDRLLDEPELAGWLLDSDWIEPHREALRELRDSPLVLNRFQKEERFLKLMGEARREIFSGPARPVYQRRLEAMAYYFLLDGREEAARKALAVSLALAPDHGADPGSIAFIAALTRRSFAAAEEAEAARAKEEKRSSVIVKPGEE